MTDLYPEIEPYERGFLEVDNGNLIYWETCGNPRGKPAVVLHGGPGSGCIPWHRRLFDPGAYRLVLFDQRNCGRSRPHASALETDLTSNTTAHLISDIEQLRQHLDIDRWLVFGGSWGCTLALAYLERYPERVTEMVSFGVTTGRHKEIDWLFRGGVAIFFPEQWDRLRNALPEAERDGDTLGAYYRQLNDLDLAVRQRAAASWCLWESATLDWPPLTRLAQRFTNPAYALAFARIVTHYTNHNLFLEDGILLREADVLASIPAILVNGRFDFQAPIANAWELKRVWPRAELVIVDNAGHAPDNINITRELIRAIDRFARLL
jgi:proline iminopeptidase